MDIILVFLATIILISIAGLVFRPPPFLTLTGGAIFFGLLTGGSLDTVLIQVTTGIGKTFATFAILILSGAVIAKVLVAEGSVQGIVADVRRFSRNSGIISGVSAYLLAIPIACCITSFIILTPIVKHLEEEPARRNALLYVAGLSSVISFALIFPDPVVIPALNLVPDFSPVTYDLLAIPVSLAILAAVIWWGRSASRTEEPAGTPPERFHLKGWAPFIVIICAIPVGLYGFRLSHLSLLSFIMLAGMITALGLATPGKRVPGFTDGAKHAGVILFDICGAGALGFIFVESGLASQAFSSLQGMVPLLFVPFLFAVLIQTAQGSRLVTAVITADILAGSAVVSAFHPFALILAIAGGACILSYVTDPYFWIIQKATGDDVMTVIRRYTVPLAGIGVVLFAVAVGVQMVG